MLPFKGAGKPAGGTDACTPGQPAPQEELGDPISWMNGASNLNDPQAKKSEESPPRPAGRLFRCFFRGC